MKLRTAKIEDIATLMEITRRCIGNLDEQGIDQWDDAYPSIPRFRNVSVPESVYGKA